MEQSIQEWTNEQFKNGPRMDKFFKGCLPQILLGPFLNTLSHITNGPYSEKARSSVTVKHEKAT